MGFQKAVRQNVWSKILLAGPSGSGKTFSALRLATGLASKCNSGIAYIDTEAGRAQYYADQFGFDTMVLQEPYSPEKYIAAIDEAIAGGYKVLCIDSLTHEWMYLNEVHAKMPGNSFTNWAPLKARHKALMEKILQAPIHIIATARGKDAYVLDTNEKGKQTPRKVGEGIDGDKQLEYNYTCTFQLIQDTHVATVMKDNTHVFEGRFEPITEKDGIALYDWCNSGKIPTVSVPPITPAEPISVDVNVSGGLNDVIARISDVTSALLAAGADKSAIADVIRTNHIVNGRPSANYKTITNIEVAKATLTSLETLMDNYNKSHS